VETYSQWKSKKYVVKVERRTPPNLVNDVSSVKMK
jgi:hypothetical protein